MSEANTNFTGFVNLTASKRPALAGGSFKAVSYLLIMRKSLVQPLLSKKTARKRDIWDAVNAFCNQKALNEQSQTENKLRSSILIFSAFMSRFGVGYISPVTSVGRCWLLWSCPSRIFFPAFPPRFQSCEWEIQKEVRTKAFSSVLSVIWSKQFLLSCFTEEWKDDLEEILEHKLPVWEVCYIPECVSTSGGCFRFLLAYFPSVSWLWSRSCAPGWTLAAGIEAPLCHAGTSEAEKE